MNDVDRMEVVAELVQHMGSINAYEVTTTKATVVYAANAAEAIAMTIDALKGPSKERGA
jgi:hypothetical protein